MRVGALCCFLISMASIAAACGASDDKKKLNGSAQGGAGGAVDVAAGMKSSTAGEPTMAAAGMAMNAAGSSNEQGGAPSEGGASPAGGGVGLGGACAASEPALPDLTQGSWLICGALAENGRIWDAVLTFESQSCDGATLAGKFHWRTTNLGTSDGNTVFNGSYDAGTGVITLDEYEVTGGNVVQATDTMTYDADSDTLVDGAWTCGCSPGSWTSATRVAAGTDVDSCP